MWLREKRVVGLMCEDRLVVDGLFSNVRSDWGVRMKGHVGIGMVAVFLLGVFRVVAFSPFSVPSSCRFLGLCLLVAWTFVGNGVVKSGSNVIERVMDPS